MPPSRLRSTVGKAARKLGLRPRTSDAEALYGGAYFGAGRDPSGDRQGLSGYASYDRISSNADIAAYLLWRNFGCTTSLDVGCATGFLVEALRELGVDAQGSDISHYAVEHATPGAKGHLKVGNLLDGLPFEDGQFELVSTLEILEHLPPADIPQALREIRRVCSGAVYATIPSFGANAAGPDGHYEGKVRPERLGHYNDLGHNFSGPVPEADLEVDAQGGPVEGHLTIASFGWWTDRFAEAGFTRRLDTEERLYADLAPTGLAPFWNLYVFAVEGADPALFTPRQPGLSLKELGLSHPLLDHREREG
jgi:SAM-dependent methyltransferase